MLTLNKKFISSPSGSTLLLVALMLPLLILVAGVAIDLGRLYAVQGKAQSALDASLLGALATKDMYGTDPGTALTTITTDANDTFQGNFPTNYLGSILPAGTNPVTVTQPDPTANVFNATVNITVPTTIMGMTSFDGLFGDGPTAITISSQATCCYINIPGQGLELALVLDNTGSMGDPLSDGTTKMDDLKTAANELMDVIFSGVPAGAAPSNIHVSVVPYDIVVQIGTGHADWMQSTPTPLPPDPPGSVPGSITSQISSQTKYNALVAAIAKGSPGDPINPINGTGGTWDFATQTYNFYSTPKGFAMNRNTDVLCGPFPYQVPATGTQPKCEGPRGQVQDSTVCPTTCTDPVFDQETNTTTPGTCYTHWCCPGADNSPSNPNGGYVSVPYPPGATWTYVTEPYSFTCVDNKLVDADDTPPTQGSQYLFRLPYESGVLVEDNEIDDSPYLASSTDSHNPNPAGNLEDHLWPYNLAPMLFGSNAQADIRATLNSMTLSGDTRINVGLMWGWFTLSPKWAGVWIPGNTSLPAPSDPKHLQKSLVLMTDGRNTVAAAGETPGVTGGQHDDAETAAMCDAIKGQGITIYTIGVGNAGTGPNDINVPLLQNCASAPGYFFLTPTADQLASAFRQVGDHINEEALRLTQ